VWRGCAEGLKDGGEVVGAAAELGETVLHEAEADDEAEWDGGEAGEEVCGGGRCGLLSHRPLDARFGVELRIVYGAANEPQVLRLRCAPLRMTLSMSRTLRDSTSVKSVEGGFGFVVEGFGFGILLAQAVNDVGWGFGDKGWVVELIFG